MADDARRQADLDWLYGNQRPNPDQTRIMDASEAAELERRRQQAEPADGPASQARAAAAAAGDQAATEAPRVVHSEGDLADAAAGTPPWRTAAPTPGRRTPAPEPRPIAAAAAASPRPAPAGPAGSGRGATPPPVDGPTRRVRRSRRRRWVRWLLLALVAWLVWLVVVPIIALGRSPQINEQPSGSRPAQEPGSLTLLVGSDKRSGLTAAQQKELGTGGSDIAGARTDTMMLLYRPASGKPVLISLPRDSYVKIPGYGHNKLNAAYGLGGPKLLVQTVENLVGLRVDNYLEVGFDGFANVVDSLGGITMCLPAPMKDAKSHTNLPAGCQNLSGTKALGYVRMRYSDPQGDLGRVKRQRAMIGAIAKKAVSPMTFIDPVRYWKLNMAAGQGLTRGQDTGTTELPGIVQAFLSVNGHADQTLTLPVKDANYQTAAGDSVLLDADKLSSMCSAMAKGDTSNLAQYAK